MKNYSSVWIVAWLTLELIGYLFGIIDKIIPKNRHLWIFCLGKGRKWEGNPCAVAEKLLTQNHRQIAICIPKSNMDMVRRFYPADIKIIPCNSLICLWYLFRSQAAFITFGTSDIRWNKIFITRSKKRLIVNLWHGAPIKNIGYSTLRDKNKISFARYSSKLEYSRYSIIICSSRENQRSMMKAFKIPVEKTPVTGLPRNDWLFVDENSLPDNLKESQKKLRDSLNGKKLILYAPTFRETGDDCYQFSTEETRQLFDFFKKHNYVLGIRKHANEKLASPLLDQPQFLDLGCDEYHEVQVLLRTAELLITDYSGIFIDFLLTQKPVVSFAYDYDNYVLKRGFLYDFKTIFPGPIAYTFEELLSAIKKIIVGGLSGTEEKKYKKTLDFFHKFKDGHSSKRVIAHVEELLERPLSVKD